MGDGLVLLLPLCYALRLWRHRQGQVVLVLIGYLFYVQRALEGVHLHPQWAYLVEFGMLMTILAMTYQLREMETPAETELRVPISVVPEERLTVSG